MKYALLTLTVIFFSNTIQAQHPDYKNLWTKVEQLEAEGLPKSALKIVEAIGKQAKKDKNNPQFIKSMLFKSKFALVLEEDAQLKIVNNFKSEIKSNSFPTKNILENILANLYWQYFNQNRWQFYNRTKTDVKIDAIDFRTWDLQTLFKEIDFYYKTSLENAKQLQLEPLTHYNVLLNEQKGSKIYRPTLFDFLVIMPYNFIKLTKHILPNPPINLKLITKPF